MDIYNQLIIFIIIIVTGSGNNQFSLSVNKHEQIVNGNRRTIGYKVAVWNCGRGLVN